MGHTLHDCPEAPEGLIESLQKNYGYPEAEKRIPLNMDRHETCPYCGAKAEDMENAPTSVVRALGRRPGKFE